MYLHKYFPKSDVSDQNSLFKLKCRKQIPQCTYLYYVYSHKINQYFTKKKSKLPTNTKRWWVDEKDDSYSIFSSDFPLVF